MQSLRVFLNARLTAAAEEIFGAVEKTICDYKEEICRSKDLEISRLRMQIKILKSVPRTERCSVTLQPQQQQQQQQQQQHSHQQPHHHPSIPPVPAAEASEETDEGSGGGGGGGGGSSMEQRSEHPEPSSQQQQQQVKKEQQQKAHRDFWMSHDEEGEEVGGGQLDGLDTDIKDFISPPLGSSNLKSGSSHLHDAVLPFHPYQNNGEENKDRPYCCSVCEKRFSNCSHLAAHIRTHTGERPYRCDICRKTFITTSALNRHQTIHTEGKHFICNYCGKSFKWMESLGRHMRCIHKRENMPV